MPKIVVGTRGVAVFARVRRADGGADPRAFTFAWDAAGNRTGYTISGTSPYSLSLTYNAANQVTTSGWTYDGAGNLTASPSRPNTYNAAGQRQTAVVGSQTSTYAYAGTNQNELLSQTTTGSSPSTYNYTYGRPDSNGLPEIERVDVSGSTTGTGNPVLLSSSSSATAVSLRYDPFGSADRLDSGGNNSAWVDNPYAFGAGVQDRVTGRIKFGARWYSTSAASWLAQDTLNAPLDPKNANRYAYAGGDPINSDDPTGRGLVNLIADIAGGLAGLGGAALCGAVSAEVPVAIVYCPTFTFTVGTSVTELINNLFG